MKRAAMGMVVLALTGLALAQTPQPQSGAQNPPQAGAQNPPAAAQTTTPQGKTPPQAKTQPEFDAYKAAASATDAASLDKAADDFAAKYPDSELRILLFKAAMHGYQNANNGDKMLDAGRKVLKIDPDDPEALVGVAEVLAERTRDTDLDKDQRLDEAMKMAQRSLQTVDSDVAIPAGTPQERVDAYKGFMKSTAYSIIGTLYYNKEKYADAEDAYRKSIDAFPSQPDPVAVLRLALSLDKQNKYPEALKEANRAVSLTQDSTPAGKTARQEQDRLMKLTGGGAPNPPANQAPPKN